ncbi:N-acetylmuramoyl-L-alanine amidase family protein [Mobilibacterium timonense]|uniref:N-acetylmuramoyl-L-alanine amidase family protein n=1 Tax=Mobilibacterium timonense TaxID=1871012 RepID=UPI0009F827FD|nr:hypothetical protein [Mobilibacterium timonense]
MRHKFFVALFTVAYIIIGGGFVNADESNALQNITNGSAVKTEVAISDQYSDHQSGESKRTEEANGLFSEGNEIKGNEETGATIDEPEQQDVQNIINSTEENKNEVQPVTGSEGNCDSWIQENGNKYYLDKTGEKVKGIAVVSGSVYYFDKDTGALKESAGWVEWNGERYFTDPSGKAYVDQFITFGSMRYYMGSDGSVQTGIITAADGRMYNADETGLVINKAQWIEENGKRLFSNSNGQLYQNQFITFGAQRYYMGSDGSAQTGIFTDADGRMYNADETGLVISKAQWIEQNGERYFANGNGQLYQNQMITFGTQKYYMGSDGSAQTGIITAADGRMYNADETGLVINKAQWIEKNGKRFFSNSNGQLYQNQFITFGAQRYYMGSDGSAQTGIFTASDGRMYNADETGLVISKAQWIEQNGKRYFANGNGQLYQNQMITFGTQRYYMGSDGSAQIGVFTASDGRMYNADETGLVISKAQWIEQNGKRYYSDGSGELYRNRFISFGSTYYYMGADGAAVTKSFTKWGDVYNPDQTGAIVNMPEGFWFWSRISSVAESLGNSLWNAYNWIAGFSRYYLTSDGRTSWPIMSSRDYAIYGLNHHGGDCIVMASTLRYIAEYLGYNAIQRFGYVGSATHSWVEINGKVYDANFKNETGRNGFGISYGQRGTWKYRIVKNI